MTFFLAGWAARAATHVMLVAIVIKVIRRIVQLGLGAISHRGWAGGAGCAWKGGVQVNLPGSLPKEFQVLKSF